MFANAFRNTGTFEYEGTVMLNIFRNVYPAFNTILKSYRTEKYTIEGNPDPTVLATILYDNPEYYWVLLLVNKVTDPFEGWLLTDKQVYTITEELYDDVNGHHHFEDSDGNFYYDLVEHNGVYYDIGDTEFTVPFYSKGVLLPVTNIEYMMSENEKKRSILIIPPEIIDQFINDLKKEFDLNVI